MSITEYQAPERGEEGVAASGPPPDDTAAPGGNVEPSAAAAETERRAGETLSGAAPAEPGAPLPPRRPDAERFIPVSRFEIFDRMTKPGMWPEHEDEDAKRFFRYLAAWRHVAYKERLDRLDEAYQPFNPETDVVMGHTYSPEERAALQSDLIKLLVELLVQANYIPVVREELGKLIAEEADYGLSLKVELEEYEECMVYRRGTAVQTLERRRPERLYLSTKTIEIPVFQRVFVLLKLKSDAQRIREIMQKEGVEERRARRMLRKARRMLPPGVSSDHIYIKLFRDIPRLEMEMLFPNTQIQFRTIDKIKLGVTGGGGTAVGVVGAAAKVIAATNPITLGLAVFGIGGMFVRQASNVISQRNRYMMTLARNLYFHSLADNRSVITLLANRAEEEDIKEEMLLYTVLAKERVHEREMLDVQAAVEQYLQSEFSRVVTFDAMEALGRLIRDGVVRRADDGTLEALSPLEGRKHLDKLWDGYLDPDGQDRQLIPDRSSSGPDPQT